MSTTGVWALRKMEVGKVLLRALPVVLGLALFAVLTRGTLVFSTDSVFYWSAAHTLLQEGQLATGIPHAGYPFETGIVEGRLESLHPLTVFAPGYSVAMAVVARSIGTSIVAAAWFVNLASGAGIILLAGSLAGRAGGDSAGLVAAALIAVLPFFQATLAEAASEPLFVAFTLLALRFGVNWIEQPDGRSGSLYTASVMNAVATYVRYIGISFYIAEAIAAIGCLLRRRAVGRRAVPVLLALGLYPVLMVPLIVRNLSLTGYLGGAARPLPGNGVLTNLVDAGRGLVDALPLVRSVMPGPADAIVSGLLLAAATAVVVVPRRSHLSQRGERTAWTASARLLTLCIAVYGSILIGLRSWVASFEGIDVRLLFPALVCLVILAVGYIAVLPGRNWRAMVGAVGVIFCGAVTFLEASYRPPPNSLTAELSRPVIRWVQENLTRQGSQAALIFADDVYAIHFATGVPVHPLPPMSRLEGLRGASPVDRLVFVIGPPTARSSLAEASERELYRAALEKHASAVIRDKDYAVWCLDRQRSGNDNCFPR